MEITADAIFHFQFVLLSKAQAKMNSFWVPYLTGLILQ